jgi:hypothetical protein
MADSLQNEDNRKQDDEEDVWGRIETKLQKVGENYMMGAS